MKLLVAFRNFPNAPIFETILTQPEFEAAHSLERHSLNEVPSLTDSRQVEFMDDVCCHGLLLHTDNITNTDFAAHTKY
jgi:hypothetical protein